MLFVCAVALRQISKTPSQSSGFDSEAVPKDVVFIMADDATITERICQKVVKDRQNPCDAVVLSLSDACPDPIGLELRTKSR